MVDKLWNVVKVFGLICGIIVVACFMALTITFTIDSVKLISAWW